MDLSGSWPAPRALAHAPPMRSARRDRASAGRETRVCLRHPIIKPHLSSPSSYPSPTLPTLHSLPTTMQDITQAMYGMVMPSTSRIEPLVEVTAVGRTTRRSADLKRGALLADGAITLRIPESISQSRRQGQHHTHTDIYIYIMYSSTSSSSIISHHLTIPSHNIIQSPISQSPSNPRTSIPQCRPS